MTTTSQRIRYAGFWRRLLAFALDSALFTALLLPVLYLIYGREYIYWLTSDASSFAVYGSFEVLLSDILPFVLLALFWLRMGATPGKLLMDCRVVDAATLQPITPRQAIIRALGYIVSALPLYLGFVWMAIDKRKQGLHDKLAGTVVLHVIDDDSHISLEEWLKLTPHESAH